jgi:hypothetical protein
MMHININSRIEISGRGEKFTLKIENDIYFLIFFCTDVTFIMR